MPASDSQNRREEKRVPPDTTTAEQLTTIPLSCVILAAGASLRMKAAMGEHKLLRRLAPTSDETLLTRTLRLYDSLPFEDIILVVSEETKSASSQLSGAGGESTRFRTIVHPRPEGGMASSIALGATAANAKTSAHANGILIALGDMPFLRRDTLIGLCRLALQAGNGAITAPLYNGKRGHPVVFGAAHRKNLARLQGEKGAQSLVQSLAQSQRESLVFLETDDAGVVIDIDSPEDWENAILRFPDFFSAL
jgi:molybdenum cofactor cytidylyltransferase